MEGAGKRAGQLRLLEKQVRQDWAGPNMNLGEGHTASLKDSHLQ